MWDVLPKPWQVCLTLSWQSYCEGSVPIAAVIVDSGGEIISQGRNRKSGSPETGVNQIIGGPLAHAEINALLALAQAPMDMHTLELFTTVEPCPLCMGAICVAGVKKIRYAARDNWSGSTDLLEASRYFRWKRIRAIPPADQELERVIHMLQVDDQLRSAHPRVQEVLERWSTEYPEDVRTGRQLFESGDLHRLRSQAVTARRMIEHVQEFTTLYDSDQV